MHDCLSQLVSIRSLAQLRAGELTTCPSDSKRIMFSSIWVFEEIPQAKIRNMPDFPAKLLADETENEQSVYGNK